MKPEKNNKKTEMKKGELAREKILAAARTVFSQNPYKAASLRMIAKEGGFDHPLIRYYFPTKADLFAVVVEEICREFDGAHLAWLDGMESLSPAKGLSHLLDRLLKYDYENPDGMRIIMQNIAQVDQLFDIPGFFHVPELFSKMCVTFKRKVPLSGREEEVDSFFNSLITAVVNYCGANTAHAQFNGMVPESWEYREYIKELLLFQFLPWLGKLALPAS